MTTADNYIYNGTIDYDHFPWWAQRLHQTFILMEIGTFELSICTLMVVSWAWNSVLGPGSAFYLKNLKERIASWTSPTDAIISELSKEFELVMVVMVREVVMDLGILIYIYLGF